MSSAYDYNNLNVFYIFFSLHLMLSAVLAMSLKNLPVGTNFGPLACDTMSLLLTGYTKDYLAVHIACTSLPPCVYGQLRRCYSLFQCKEILQEEEDLSEIVQLVGKVCSVYLMVF